MRRNWWPPAASVAIVGIGIGVIRSDGTIVISAALISLMLAVVALVIHRRKGNGTREGTDGPAVKLSQRRWRVSAVEGMVLILLAATVVVFVLWLVGAV